MFGKEQKLGKEKKVDKGEKVGKLGKGDKVGKGQKVGKAVTVSKTKFYHAVAVLPQKVAAQILDLIRAPPARTPYEVLKDRLITLYSLNDYQRYEALVSLPLSGDQKPSHFMNRIYMYSIFYIL